MGTILDLDRSQSEATISVITPLYNESDKVVPNLERLFGALDRMQRHYEVVVVNDGSTDDSMEKIRQFAAGQDHLVAVTYRNNRGRGYAIRQGFAQAKGDILVVTEGDLSYGTDIIRELVDKMEQDDLDVVVASPHCPGGGLINVPFARQLYTTVGNRMLRILMPVQLTTYTGMTRAYKKSVVESLDMENDDKELHLEILIKVAHLGYRIDEIPAVLEWEPSRKKRTGSFKAKKYVKSHLIFGLMQAPFKIMAVLSFILFAVGTGSGLHLLLTSLRGIPVAGRPLLFFSMLCIIASFFIFLFGFLALQNINLERKLHRLSMTAKERSRG